jgi:hypothetical protein
MLRPSEGGWQRGLKRINSGIENLHTLLVNDRECEAR